MKFGAATRPKAVRAERAASSRRLVATFLLGAVFGALIVIYSPRAKKAQPVVIPQPPPQLPAVAATELALKQRTKLLAFVGVNTGYGSAGRRKVLRETWFPSTPELLSQ